jgi:ATP-dependent RNA helicase RhlE
VATDIAARGIDIESLGHVVNFDVPKVPEDYIHRVGRTARAEAVGDAFTFVAPEEEGVLRGIERVIGKRLPRVIVPDFDYAARAGARLEIPIGDRIVAIRARKAEDRARAEVRTRRRLADESARARREGPRHEPRTGPEGAKRGEGRGKPRPRGGRSR